DPPDVLRAVRRTEAQVAVQPVTHVVAVQDEALAAAREQRLFQRPCERALARTRKAREPQRRTAMPVRTLPVRTRDVPLRPEDVPTLRLTHRAPSALRFPPRVPRTAASYS